MSLNNFSCVLLGIMKCPRGLLIWFHKHVYKWRKLNSKSVANIFHLDLKFVSNCPFFFFFFREKSYIICHAPIFWWRVNQRFNFANSFWQLEQIDRSSYNHVTFANPHTSMGNCIPRAASDMVFGQGFKPTYYKNSMIMKFHWYAFNHFGAMVIILLVFNNNLSLTHFKRTIM